MNRTRREREYDIIESKYWRHKATGRRVSIYGALPWVSDEQREAWELVSVGWTVRSRAQGTVGIGRVPWKTREEVIAWMSLE